MWLLAVVNNLIKYIKLSWNIFIANLLSALSFRLSFLFYAIGATLFYAGQFFLWIVFFKQFPLIGGWVAKDLILAYSLFVFSYSIINAFAGGVTDLAKIINSGELDYFLVFPKPVLWHVAVSKSDIYSVGTAVFSISFFLFSRPFDILQIILFLIASCFAILLMFNFFVLTQSLAFFIGGFDQGASMIRNLLRTVSTYPFNIFPVFLKFFLMTFIPSFFIITLPAKLVTDFSLQTLIILICVNLFLSVVSYKVFNLGLSRYESGNLLNTRT